MRKDIIPGPYIQNGRCTHYIHSSLWRWNKNENVGVVRIRNVKLCQRCFDKYDTSDPYVINTPHIHEKDVCIICGTPLIIKGKMFVVKAGSIQPTPQ